MEDSPFEEKRNPKVGRYLIAKKRLPRGAIIFKEAPISVVSKFDSTAASSVYFTCSVCFRILKISEQAKCKQCWWPFCTQSCARNERHRGLECQVFRTNHVLPTRKSTRYLYLVKLLLLETKYPKKWKQLMNLSAQEDSEVSTPEEANIRRSILSAESFLKESCNMEVSRSLIWKVKNILKVNAFGFIEGKNDNGKESWSCMDNKDPSYCHAVYPITCLMQHSCAHNLDWRRCQGSQDEPFTICLFTRRDIEAGEVVSVSYKGDFSLQGTQARRQNLLEPFGFLCLCSRCTDPTEMGTFYSAIKCLECPDGWLLPDSNSEDERSICNECGHSKTTENVVEIENRYQGLLDAAKSDEDISEDYLDWLLLGASNEYGLHPNHRLVIQANKLWLEDQDLEMLLETGPEVDEMYRKLIKRAEQLLTILELFGTTKSRISLNDLISSAIISYHFKSADFISIRADISDVEQKIMVIGKIQEHLFRGLNDTDPLTCSEKEFQRRTELHATWEARLMKCQNDCGKPGL